MAPPDNTPTPQTVIAFILSRIAELAARGWSADAIAEAVGWRVEDVARAINDGQETKGE